MRKRKVGDVKYPPIPPDTPEETTQNRNTLTKFFVSFLLFQTLYFIYRHDPAAQLVTALASEPRGLGFNSPAKQ